MPDAISANLPYPLPPPWQWWLVVPSATEHTPSRPPPAQLEGISYGMVGNLPTSLYLFLLRLYSERQEVTAFIQLSCCLLEADMYTQSTTYTTV